jgi:hypothetical protein
VLVVDKWENGHVASTHHTFHWQLIGWYRCSNLLLCSCGEQVVFELRSLEAMNFILNVPTLFHDLLLNKVGPAVFCHCVVLL